MGLILRAETKTYISGSNLPRAQRKSTTLCNTNVINVLIREDSQSSRMVDSRKGFKEDHLDLVLSVEDASPRIPMLCRAFESAVYLGFVRI